MGFFDALFGGKQLPTVTSILPVAAKQEIMAGRLPILNADTIFPKKGERIHFIDKAMNMEVKTTKTYEHIGLSTPGLFKGNRVNYGRGKPIERQENVFHAGVLYITNQRIIFQAKENGFDKSFKYLTAFVPYSNGIELQFGNKSYTLLLQDGVVVNQTIQLIKQRRSSY